MNEYNLRHATMYNIFCLQLFKYKSENYPLRPYYPLPNIWGELKTKYQKEKKKKCTP